MGGLGPKKKATIQQTRQGMISTRCFAPTFINAPPIVFDPSQYTRWHRGSIVENYCVPLFPDFLGSEHVHHRQPSHQPSRVDPLISSLNHHNG
jgi:hypothetical protein